MKRKPILTIKINGNTDTVTVDGQVYDRSKMDRKERDMMRKIIVQGLFNV